MGDGSPGSREAGGEGGEGFYTAQSSRSPDLLIIWGGRVDNQARRVISDMIGSDAEVGDSEKDHKGYFRDGFSCRLSRPSMTLPPFSTNTNYAEMLFSSSRPTMDS